MTVDTYRRRIASTAIVLAREDPLLVKEVIARLRASGEIAVDDLVYLDRIADRWIGIAEGLRRGAARRHRARVECAPALRSRCCRRPS